MLGDQQIEFGLTASFIAGCVSTLGILSMAFFATWSQRNSSYFSAFAVGVLTVAVLFHLIPEAMDISLAGLGWVGAGFGFMVLVGIAVQIATNNDDNDAALTFGYASIIALGVHSLLDGVFYAASFQEGVFTGWLSVAGLLLHEFPEGAIAYFLLQEAGVKKLRSAVLAFLAASLTTVIGTVGAYSMLSLAVEIPLASLLGAAAGGLIYVLIVHLGPHAAKAPGNGGYIAAAFGVMVSTTALILQNLSGAH